MFMSLKLDPLPKEGLQIAQESISDAFKEGLDNFTNLLKVQLPNIIRGIRESDDLNKLPGFNKITREEVKFLKLLNSVSYNELKELKAFVPEGLNVKLIQYLDAIEPSVNYLTRLLPDVVEPYAKELTYLACNPIKALDTNSNKEKYLKQDKNRALQLKAITDCFSNKHYDTKICIGNLVDRNADWVTIFNRVRDITNKIKMINRKEISLLVTQCEQDLELIYQYIKSGKYNYITPEVANNIATGAWHIASELEYCSVVYFKVLGLESSIEQTINKVNEVLS